MVSKSNRFSIIFSVFDQKLDPMRTVIFFYEFFDTVFRGTIVSYNLIHETKHATRSSQGIVDKVKTVIVYCLFVPQVTSLPNSIVVEAIAAMFDQTFQIDYW
jgi:hypothetical protein